MTASKNKRLFTFAADFMPGQGRGFHLRRQAASMAAVAYAATSLLLLLAFNFKWRLFKCFSEHYPLTITQNPRRNHYGPMGSVIFMTVFGISLDLSACFSLRIGFALVVKLLTAAKSNLHLNSGA